MRARWRGQTFQYNPVKRFFSFPLFVFQNYLNSYILVLSAGDNYYKTHWYNSIYLSVLQSEPGNFSNVPTPVSEEALTTALIQQSPLRLMLPLTACRSSNFLKALLAYYEPRSEWWISPVLGRRCQTAIFNASHTSCAFICELILQTTTSRKHSKYS